MAMYGRPRRDVLLKIFGAFPTIARPYKARELVYKSLEAADHADVNRQALMTDGSPLIPERWMAITKGEAAAVPDFKLRPGSFEGTKSPIINVPPI